MRRRNLILGLLGVVAVVAVVLVIATLAGDGDGGGSDRLVEPTDPEPDNTSFHVKAVAIPFSGPTPLKVRFKVRAYDASGDVRYRWRFDDGTTSFDESPTHTFPQASFYGVVLDARDEKAGDRENLLLGAWPPNEWGSGASALSTRSFNRRYQRMLRRTERRRRAQERAAGGHPKKLSKSRIVTPAARPRSGSG